MSNNKDSLDYVRFTARIVAGYVVYNHVSHKDLPELIVSMATALGNLGGSTATAPPAAEKLTPSQIRRSIMHDALISFEDGKPYKTLRRHLTTLELTPEAYRRKWGLPNDYPMVAPGYAEMRSQLAKRTGLGRRRPAEVSGAATS